MEEIYEEYQKDIYQVQHKVNFGFEAGFRAIKYQLIPAILESTFSDEQKLIMIEKYTHSLLNRTCKDWMQK